MPPPTAMVKKLKSRPNTETDGSEPAAKKQRLEGDVGTVKKIGAKKKFASVAEDVTHAEEAIEVVKQQQEAPLGETGGKTKTKKEKEAEKEQNNPELREKRKRRKEVTKLYGELTSPGKARKDALIVGEIMELLHKRHQTLDKYCAKDVGSRVLQACLKWGSHEQRRQVLTALQKDIPKLATDRYGHMVVLKLLRYISRTAAQRKPTADERAAQVTNLKNFLEGFRGKSLITMFFQKYGCKVVNDVCFSPVVSKKEKRRIIQEVAVAEKVMALRPQLCSESTLRKLLKAEDLPEEHRKETMSHLRELLEKAVDKALLNHEVVHLLFQAFCEVANESQLRDVSEKSLPGAPHLLSSKPGAEALIRMMGTATAKERKAFCRDLKGKFVALAMNAVDYLVVMRLASTVDDTVLLEKTMLAEWTTDMASLCQDKYGHRVLAWLLVPGDKRFFSPYERECLALPAPSSLKAAETRQQELLRLLRPSLRTALTQNVLKIASDTHAKDLLVAYLAADWDGELVEALLRSCTEAIKAGDFGPLSSGPTSTALMHVLKLEPQGTKDAFAMPLWQRCFEPWLTAAASSPAVRILLAMLKLEGSKVREAVLKGVRSHRKEVEAAAKAAEAKGGVVTGIRQLLKEAC